MNTKTFIEERDKLLKIMEKYAPVFKYELTRLHLSEDQIEAIYPMIVQFLEKVYREFHLEQRSEQ